MNFFLNPYTFYPSKAHSSFVYYFLDFLEQILIQSKLDDESLISLKNFLTKHNINSLSRFFFNLFKFDFRLFNFFKEKLNIEEKFFNLEEYDTDIREEDKVILSIDQVNYFKILINKIFTSFIFKIFYQSQFLYMESHYQSSNYRYLITFFFCLELISLQFRQAVPGDDLWMFERKEDKSCLFKSESILIKESNEKDFNSYSNFHSLYKLLITSLYNFSYSSSFITLNKFKSKKTKEENSYSFSFTLLHKLLSIGFSSSFLLLLQFLEKFNKNDKKLLLLMKLKYNVLLEKSEKYEESIRLNQELLLEVENFSTIEDSFPEEKGYEFSLSSSSFTASYSYPQIFSQYFFPGFFLPLLYQDTPYFSSINEDTFSSNEEFIHHLNALTNFIKEYQLNSTSTQTVPEVNLAMEYFKSSKKFDTADSVSLEEIKCEIESRIDKIRFLLKKYNLLSTV